MSQIGQTGPINDAELLGDPTRPIIASALDLPTRQRIPPHSHVRAQLVYAVSGVFSVETAYGSWLVPPQQAVWVPSGVIHEVRAPGPVAMRNLYLHPDAVQDLPDQCRVIAVSGLLRELILRAVDIRANQTRNAAQCRIGEMIIDELRISSPEPLHLPLAADRRLKSVTKALAAHPADRRTLGEWAKWAGASERTMARLFIRETGLTFGVWRQRLRLIQAVKRLAEDEAVTSIAYDLGYDSLSAFVAMFRKELGMTPGRYFRNNP